MTLQNKNLFIGVAVGIGVLFNILFYKTVVGVSFLLFIGVLLIGGVFLLSKEDVKPSGTSLWLLLPILFFSTMSFIRTEPMTHFLNSAASLLLLALFAHSYQGGNWPNYGLMEYLSGVFSLGISALSKQWGILLPAVSETTETNTKKGKLKAIFRGLFIAIPVLLLFGSLLSAADPIFEIQVDRFFSFILFDNLDQIINQVLIIGVISYLVLGVFLHSLSQSNDTPPEHKNPMAILGFTEISVVMVSVIILFASFVLIQIKYFFGGEANFSQLGITYSEYARKGFFELIAVAVFSYLLILILTSFAKDQTKAQKFSFSVLGAFLVSMVLVMLVSAYQRLNLYESAFGFTRLRTYTHIFIWVLALLLIAILILLFLKAQGLFNFSALVAALIFICVLNLLNVDAFIAVKNIARLDEKQELDIPYLASLSTDMIPVLVQQLDESSAQVEAIQGIILCHAYLNQSYDFENYFYDHYDWRSFNLSRSRALQSFMSFKAIFGNENLMETFNSLSKDSEGLIEINGFEFTCFNRYD